MEITPEHTLKSARLIAFPDAGPPVHLAAVGYLQAVEKTTSFNGGHLHFAVDGGAMFNADSAYAAISSSPGDRHAEVEIDGRFLPKDLRSIAFGLLVHADELEGR